MDKGKGNSRIQARLKRASIFPLIIVGELSTKAPNMLLSTYAYKYLHLPAINLHPTVRIIVVPSTIIKFLV